MENLTHNENIAYRAIQQSRPGPSSWLALLLFVGSLVLAFELRDKIIEGIEYRELLADAAVLNVVSRVILGFAIVLAVAGAFMAWRMWWTLSLIGTTTLGMPDVAAIGASKLRTGTGRSAGAGLCLATACLRKLGRATVGAFGLLRLIATHQISLLLGGIALLRAAVVGVSSILWGCLTIVGSPFHAAGIVFLRYSLVALIWILRYFWLVISVSSMSVWRGTELATTYLWLVVRASFLAVWLGVEFVARYLWLTVSSSCMSVWRGLVFVARYLWLVVRASSLAGWWGVELVTKYLWLAVSSSCMSVWRGGVFVARYLWLAVKASFLAVWWGGEFVAKYFWLVLSVASLSGWRDVGFVANYLWLAVSVSSMSVWQGMSFVAKYLGLAVLAPFALLIIGFARSSYIVWDCICMLWSAIQCGGAAVREPIFMMFANGSRQLRILLASAGIGVWLAASTASAILGRCVTRVIRTLGAGAFWLSLTLKHGGFALGKPVAAATVICFRRLGSFLSLAGNSVRSATSALLIILGRCVTGVIKGVWNVASRFWLILWYMGTAAGKPVFAATVILCRELWSVLTYVGNGAWLAVSVPSRLLAKGIVRSVSNVWYGITRLWLILGHGGAAASGAIRATLTVFFRSQGRGLGDFVRNIRSAMSNVRLNLQVSLGSAGRASRSTFNATLRCSKSILKSGMSNMVIAIPILVLSPLLALRLILDQAYRREVAARSRVVFAALWARRVVGVAGFGVVSVVGLAAFTVGEIVWPSQAPVEVVIWTGGEKEKVLLPSLKRFNESGLTITVDGRRYPVQARPVSMDPTEMHDALVAKINEGKDFPEWTLGAPTVVSPVHSGWLDQINEGTEKDVFHLDEVRPIVRTPIVILTYRGMAECLGWPERPIGWADVIALPENPEGWGVCPTAQPEWGEKPLVAFPGAEGSSVGGTVLQILHIIDAGKAAEWLTFADVENLEVRTLADRFQAIVDHYYSEMGEFQAEMRQGPGVIHFVPVEEYTIPYLYQDWADAGEASGYEIVAIYPREGTLWHDNPFAIPNAPWVNEVQREAAHLVEEYLRSEEVQARFMESGFRPGIFVKQSDLLTPPKGLDLKQPAVILGRIPAGTARAIQQRWKGDAAVSDNTLELTIPSSPSMAGQNRDH